jgi:hypothetical protein
MLAEKANDIVLNARANSANSQNEMHESVPDWIAARGYDFTPRSQFYYPQGSLLSLSSVN